MGLGAVVKKYVKKGIFMNFRQYVKIFLASIVFSGFANAMDGQIKAMQRIKEAERYIYSHGKKRAMLTFQKKSSRIFVINYNGSVLASPLHPEMIGTNQINFKDPSGVYAVKEEIQKAKLGGGWLKGRFRKNPETGKDACRKIYIYPMPDHYLIGSWYHYPVSKEGICSY